MHYDEQNRALISGIDISNKKMLQKLTEAAKNFQSGSPGHAAIDFKKIPLAGAL